MCTDDSDESAMTDDHTTKWKCEKKENIFMKEMKKRTEEKKKYI